MGSSDTDRDGDTGVAGDLDALIGDIRREAARRRAAPDFPLDEEARLSAEMDAHGPAGIGGADLAAITAAVQAAERTGDASAAEVAGLTASAVRALSVRLAELERRSTRRTAAPLGPRTADHAGPDLLAAWIDDVAAVTGTDPQQGRVLVAGPDAPGWVDRLRSIGCDVYGVDPEGEPFGDQGAVRRGGIRDHLTTVGDSALGVTLIVGPLPVAESQGIAQLAAEAVRTSRRVMVCSEAPWAWRRRVGDAAADTSPNRPLGPEAWLQALTSAGMPASGRYDSLGTSYLLRADPAAEVAG